MVWISFLKLDTKFAWLCQNMLLFDISMALRIKELPNFTIKVRMSLQKIMAAKSLKYNCFGGNCTLPTK